MLCEQPANGRKSIDRLFVAGLRTLKGCAGALSTSWRSLSARLMSMWQLHCPYRLHAFSKSSFDAAALNGNMYCCLDALLGMTDAAMAAS